MPSPIAHSAVAFLIWPLLKGRGSRATQITIHHPRGLMLLGGVLVMLNGPDVDFIPHILLRGGSESAWLMHGGATHSLSVGIVAATVFATVFHLVTGIHIVRLFLVGVLAWWLHVLMDVFTYQGGVAALWPLSSERFAAPVPLFFGVRHSEPWAWHLHLITVSTELVFAAFMYAAGTLTQSRTFEHPQKLTSPCLEIKA